MTALPKHLKDVFWDYDFNTLSWDSCQNLVIRRILVYGDWTSILWLRKQLNDDNLRSWIFNHKGRGLSPKQLRFWEFILDLPHEDVNHWIESMRKIPWENR